MWPWAIVFPPLFHINPILCLPVEPKTWFPLLNHREFQEFTRNRDTYHASQETPNSNVTMWIHFTIPQAFLPFTAKSHFLAMEAWCHLTRGSYFSFMMCSEIGSQQVSAVFESASFVLCWSMSPLRGRSRSFVISFCQEHSLLTWHLSIVMLFSHG